MYKSLWYSSNGVVTLVVNDKFQVMHVSCRNWNKDISSCRTIWCGYGDPSRLGCVCPGSLYITLFKISLIIRTTISPTVLELKLSSAGFASCRGSLCWADWVKVFPGNWRRERLIELSSTFLKRKKHSVQRCSLFFSFFNASSKCS